MTHSFVKTGAHGAGTSTALTFTRASDGPGGGAFNPANKSLLVAKVSVKLVNHTAITGPDASWHKLVGAYESNSPNDVSISLWWKQATASEPSTYVWTFTGGGTGNIEIDEFSTDIDGAWAGDVSDLNNGDNSTHPSITFPTGVTPTNAASVLVAAATTDNSDGTEGGETIDSPFTLAVPPSQTSRIISGWFISSTTANRKPTLGWSTPRRTAAVLGVFYKVPPVGVSLSLEWDVVAEVRKDNTLEWDVDTTVGKAATLEWDVLVAAAVANTLEWDVQAEARGDLTLEWDLGGPVAAVLSAVWDVDTTVGIGVDLRWQVRQPPVVASRVSSADLLDLRFVGIRSSTIRWDLLDQGNNVYGTISPSVEQAPTITNDVTRAVKRDLAGLVLSPADQAAVNPFSDRVRPVMVLQNGEEFPMGVYLFVQGSRTPATYGRTFTGHLLDQCWVVDQPVAKSFGLQPGTSIRDALVALLADTPGIAPVTIDAFSTVVGKPGVVQPGGTSKLKIVNDLCALAGCYDLYFDNYGAGHIRLVPTDLTAVTPTVTYIDGTPGGGPVGNIIGGTTVETDNLISAPNRIVVVDSQAQDSPVVGIYDIPSSAPNSFAQRGERVIAYISQQGVPDVAAAVAIGRAAAAKSAADYSWWSFQGMIDPRHDTYDILSVRGQIVREQKWSTQVKETAPMSHDVRLAYA